MEVSNPMAIQNIVFITIIYLRASIIFGVKYGVKFVTFFQII